MIFDIGHHQELLQNALYGKSDNIFPDGITAQQALNILAGYLLGADWCIADPLSNAQVNTLLVRDILLKYSKKYKKEQKKALKEREKSE